MESYFGFLAAEWLELAGEAVRAERPRASLMKLIESGDIEPVKVGTPHRVPAAELVACQRARQVSRERAAELLTEFSSRSTGFQSNVTFRADAPRFQHVLGEGRES